jgi:hypothetical protein
LLSYFTKKVLPVLVLSCFVVSSASAVLTTLSNVPDYDWYFGCSPTSVGMLLGYYDRNGYDALTYDSLIAGGTAELSTWDAGGSPLADAAIASSGHRTDFYNNEGAGTRGSVNYLNVSDDLPAPWHDFDSIADFMGTSQDAVANDAGMGNPPNADGSTNFWNWVNGTPFTWSDAETNGVTLSSGMYGIKEYIEYRDYGIATLFNQYILGYNVPGYGPTPDGLTFADYQAEIDAGRPAVIHVEGHSMLAYGYDTAGQKIYLHDTWSAGPHTMKWGGSYGGMVHSGFTFLTISDGDGGEVPVPEPATILLIGSGIFGLAAFLRRKKAA